jgi:uncharacterized membrane protein YeaQ/YmgE (transglycosylase-associated protein family)
MGIVGWTIVGLVAGAFAQVATRFNRRAPQRRLGCLGTIAIGVLGGLLGGALFNWAGDDGIGEFGLRSMFVAFVGACLLLLVVGAATRR